MTDKKRLIAGIVLATVYAFFFASTNLFYHSHVISSVKIVHSHPWSGAAHSHSSDQATFIQHLDSTIYEGSELISAPGPMFQASVRQATESPVARALSGSILSFSLRAPPAYC